MAPPKEALKNANKASQEADNAVSKLEQARKQLSQAEDYAFDINDVLKSVYGQFDKYFEHLKYLDRHIEEVRSRRLDPQVEMAKFSDTILQLIDNGYALAAILVDLITTPLFKLKEVNGEVVKDKNNVPVMATDADGSMILNAVALDQQLAETRTKAAAINPA